MRRMALLLSTAFLLAATAAAGADAVGERSAGATSGKLRQLMSMKVLRIKSDAPGCEPNCPEWISAEGMIDESTLPQFKKVLKELGAKTLPILIDSGGGLVDESLAIGRLIRAHGLDIAVSKTVIPACAGPAAETEGCRQAKAHAIVPGHPRSYLARCASSCAFILAGGVHRFVGPAAFVGVHQLKTIQTSAQLLRKYRIETRTEWGIPVEVRRVLISEKRINEKTSVARTPDSAYVKVAKYFAEMGVTDGVMPIIKATPNASIHWMTRAELKATAMSTDATDAESIALGTVPRSPVLQRFDSRKEFGASPMSPPLPSVLIPSAPAKAAPVAPTR